MRFEPSVPKSDQYPARSKADRWALAESGDVIAISQSSRNLSRSNMAPSTSSSDIVEAKTKPYLFERFIDSLYAHQPHSVTVIEDLSPDTTNADEQVDLSEDTITIINREIDGLQNVDGAKLKALLRDLYTETQALENTKQQ